MNWQSTIEGTLSIFAHWALVAGIYYCAKFVTTYSLRHDERMAKVKHKVFTYIYCVAICFFLSLMFGFQLGSHTESDDGIGPGETVIDFEPTDQERWEHGAKSLFILLPSALLGTYVGFRRDEKLTSEERRERNKELNKPPRDNW